ncbi:hypothetical protein D3C79_792050 [compost metagenome]
MQRTAGNHENIGSATGADIAADSTGIEEDLVVAKAGDQVADDGAAGHAENVVVQLHVDPADAATGEERHVTVFEGTDDPSRRHVECIAGIALGQGLQRAAGHQEVIDKRRL